MSCALSGICNLIQETMPEMMNESSMYSRNKTVNYGDGFEFDYQSDFTQFLEEARKSGLNSSRPVENKQPEAEEVKKKRKSWKKSLFSWLKSADKLSKSSKQRQVNGTVFPKPRWGHVSGPLQGTGAGSTASRVKRAASGPLTGLFSSSIKRVESHEVPYICLSQLNSPNKLQAYGPIYLVT